MTKPKLNGNHANPVVVKMVFDDLQTALFALAVYRLREEPNPILNKLAENGHEGGAIVARASRFVLERRGRAASMLKP